MSNLWDICYSCSLPHNSFISSTLSASFLNLSLSFPAYSITFVNSSHSSSIFFHASLNFLVSSISPYLFFTFSSISCKVPLCLITSTWCCWGVGVDCFLDDHDSDRLGGKSKSIEMTSPFRTSLRSTSTFTSSADTLHLWYGAHADAVVQSEQWLNIKSSLAMPMIICSAERVAINFVVRQERYVIEQITIHNQATLNLLHVAGHLAWWDGLHL